MQPSTEVPVRMTSIGWLAAGSACSASCTDAGNSRSAQLATCSRKLRGVRQVAVHQQVRDLLELALVREIEDVVAAVVQIVAAAAHRAERGIAGDHAGKGDRFLRLEAGGRSFVAAHGCALGLAISRRLRAQELVELALVLVVAEHLVQFRTRLHAVDHARCVPSWRKAR